MIFRTTLNIRLWIFIAKMFRFSEFDCVVPVDERKASRRTYFNDIVVLRVNQINFKIKLNNHGSLKCSKNNVSTLDIV